MRRTTDGDNDVDAPHVKYLLPALPLKRRAEEGRGGERGDRYRPTHGERALV